MPPSYISYSLCDTYKSIIKYYNTNTCNNQKSSDIPHIQWITKYIHTAIAAGCELTLGQPLDRLKIHYQTPLTERSPIQFSNWRYWYAGNIPAIVQRCGIYLPGITAAAGVADILIVDKDSLTSRLCKPLIVSGLVSPYVTVFEFIKNYQQQQYLDIHSDKSRLTTYNIIKNNKTRDLTRALLPTMGREYCFVSGMLVLQPIFAKYITNQYNSNNIITWIVSSMSASAISQVLSQPLDTWKTRIELYPDQPIMNTLRSIPVAQLWSGMWPRIIRGAWTFGCVNMVLQYLA